MNEGRPSGPVRTAADVDRLYRQLIESATDYAIFVLDPGGHVITWNPGAERLKGYTADEIIGQHFSRFYPAEVIARRWPEHELEVAAQEGRFEDEAWRLRKDGSRFWANVVITALRDEHGKLIGFGKVTRDLSARRQQEEALRHSEERLRLLVENVQDYAIFMLDRQGRIASWNVGAQRIKGYTADEVIGRHFSIFYPPDQVAIDWPAHELRVARAEGRYEEEGWRVRKDGARFWANVIITAVLDTAGVLRGYAKVTRDLTQRRHVETLQEASRNTSEFLAMLAHELRNPLASIGNAMQIMALRRSDDEYVESARAIVERQVGLLSKLVDDLLDVSRITTGKITLKLETVELAFVLDRAIESSMPLIESRRHAIRISMPNASLAIQADVTRMSQVFLNLLVNAAKYTPDGGQIELAARTEDGDALVTVRDNGIGIPAELLPRIFEPFVQGSRALDRSEGGLGIGLTLVRDLVRLHGGRIFVAPAPGGQGTEFTVRLPLAAAGSMPEPRAHARDASSPDKGRHVLVVDDNKDSAETMAQLLRLSGYEVDVARDGPSAIEKAASVRPDACLLDIGLPGMNGYAVAEKLRSLPQLAGLTLIAMTGYGQEEDRKRTRDAGFDHHLVKPVDLTQLVELLEHTGATSATSRHPAR